MSNKFFKVLSFVFVLSLVLSAFVSFNNTQAEAKVKKVRLNKTELTMNPGGRNKLKLKNLDYEIDDIEWSSSNKSVAKVTKKGWVMAIVKGECTITAKVLATNETFSCNVKVVVPDKGERVIDPAKPIVALTFDDGPGANTEALLDTLASYGATATFFMCYYNGSGINYYGADIVRKVYNSGNEVANHTQNHPDLKTCSRETIDKEVNGNADKIRNILGTSDRLLLRPPYGSYNNTVKEVANVPIIIWSVDSRDWEYTKKENATELIMQNIKKEVHDGAIILMHDIHKSSCEAAKTVLPWLIQQGYQVCSVSEMFKARGVKLENGKVYSSCISAEKYKTNKSNAQKTEKINMDFSYNAKVVGIESWLNVRKDAGTEYDRITDENDEVVQLGPDEAVIVSGYKFDSDGVVWYKIKFNREDKTYTAYVISTYLKVDVENPIKNAA